MVDFSLAFFSPLGGSSGQRSWEGVRADEDRGARRAVSKDHGREDRLGRVCGGRSIAGAELAMDRPWPRLSSLTDSLTRRYTVLQKLVKFPMEVSAAKPDDPRVAGLGENLRRARTALGLTQEEVAERSGVHATEVSRIEAGKRDPKVSTLMRLAKAVEVPPGVLLD
jgi:DNA-binding XRE family transcriptional regulator